MIKYLKKISSLRSYNTMDILDSLARLNNSKYVPVGNAFNYVEENYPHINLYMDDNKHPSPNVWLNPVSLWESICPRINCYKTKNLF